MSRRKINLARVALILQILVIVVCVERTLATAATFTPLGGTGWATDVSGDGKVVVGVGAGYHPFRWSASEQMVTAPDFVLPFAPGHPARNVRSLTNYDGSIVAGTYAYSPFFDEEAYAPFVWPKDGAPSLLPNLPAADLAIRQPRNLGAPIYQATTISSDGATIWGVTSYSTSQTSVATDAISWSAGGVPQKSNGPAGTFVTGSSKDGSVSVGIPGSFSSPWYDSYLFAGPVVRWKNGVPATIDGLRGGYASGFYAPLDIGFGPRVSADGKVVTRYSASGASRWTESDGLEALGNMNMGVLDVSGDGSVIVGGLGESGRSHAVIWTAKKKVENLYDKLIQQGTAGLDGWQLVLATGVSDDGRVIVGAGINPSGQTEAWMAQLGSASLIFRENNNDAKEGTWGRITGDEIPGWDHVGLEVNNRVYESHPGYSTGPYYDPIAQDFQPISLVEGIQSQHSLGSFKHDSESATTTPVAQFAQISIPQNAAEKMADAINARAPAGFRTIDRSDLRLSLSPDAQKGGADRTFTCVGLVEWAAEQTGINNGEGFIPNSMETIRFTDSLSIDPIPTLSPQLLYWVLNGEQDLAGNINNWLQGMFDPVDFVLTDPLGRRLGHTAALGDINEIPGALYSGDGDIEQFLILNPLRGHYMLETFGINGEPILAAFGDRLGGRIFDGVLNSGESHVLTYDVVPEPRSTVLCLVTCLICMMRERSKLPICKTHSHKEMFCQC